MHSKFKRIINFINDKNKIVAISENIDFLSPNTLIIRNVDVNDIKSVEITDDTIYIDNSSFLKKNCTIYKSIFNFEKVFENDLHNNIKHFIENYLKLFNSKSLGFLIENSREEFFTSSFDRAYVKHMKNGYSELLNGDFSKGIKELKGSGFGLTPSGDDFVSGILLALIINQNIYSRDLNNLRKSIKDIAIGNNPISNALINNSYKGAMYIGFKNFQNAFLYDYLNIETALDKLLAIGETSGSDILTGYLLTLKHKFGV